MKNCRALVTAVQIYRNSCSTCPQIARHAILGNSISVLFDALLHSLQVSSKRKNIFHEIQMRIDDARSSSSNRYNAAANSFASITHNSSAYFNFMRARFYTHSSSFIYRQRKKCHNLWIIFFLLSFLLLSFLLLDVCLNTRRQMIRHLRIPLNYRPN